MRVINTLIADDNYEFWEIMKGLLSEYSDINVLDYAGNGFETIEMIKLMLPDVIILDIIMPNLDGIAVIEKVRSMKLEKQPVIIVLTAVDKETVIQRAFKLGADYYILKPIEMEVLARRIRQLYNDKYSFSEAEAGDINYAAEETALYMKSNDACVSELLNEFGIPLHLLGYKYLKEVILEGLNNPSDKKRMAKELYAKIACKYGVNTQKVERAIRNAIEIAWMRGNKDSMDYLLGYFPSFSKDKPTNSEFIALMIDRAK